MDRICAIIRLFFVFYLFLDYLSLVIRLFPWWTVFMEQEEMIGREEEQRRLRRCLAEKTSQFIVVYGRRRVGKTFLIQQTFEGQFDFRLTGAYNQPRSAQLRNFAAELKRQSGKTHPVPKDWTDALEMLRSYLNSLPEDKKHIIFFDEMPWLDTQRSGFLPAFEWFWNDYGATRDNLICIVCGSATSWMVKNIAKNKGCSLTDRPAGFISRPLPCGKRRPISTQGRCIGRDMISQSVI